VRAPGFSARLTGSSPAYPPDYCCNGANLCKGLLASVENFCSVGEVLLVGPVLVDLIIGLDQ